VVEGLVSFSDPVSEASGSNATSTVSKDGKIKRVGKDRERCLGKENYDTNSSDGRNSTISNNMSTKQMMLKMVHDHLATGVTTVVLTAAAYCDVESKWKKRDNVCIT
jgi:hypothetical protein